MSVSALDREATAEVRARLDRLSTTLTPNKAEL